MLIVKHVSKLTIILMKSIMVICWVIITRQGYRHYSVHYDIVGNYYAAKPSIIVFMMISLVNITPARLGIIVFMMISLVNITWQG